MRKGHRGISEIRYAPCSKNHTDFDDDSDDSDIEYKEARPLRINMHVC